uniref:Uncharacterized protein n=1 Tax=Tanacetum cinerariifolium TaxID=118510 RepID=A0A6L2P4T1_TANCI|nr:hypothetical protein [Tanacetum cinerariifolium]
MRYMCNEDLRTELEYFSEEYDKEKEMEPRLSRARETTPVLRTLSLRDRRQRERVVEFEDAQNKDGGRVERISEGGRPSKRRAEDNWYQGMNLPSLLAAHLRRTENAQPLQSSLISVHGGHLPSVNTRGNRHPTGTHLSHNAQPFVPNNLQPPSGPIPTYVNPYPQPNIGSGLRTAFKLSFPNPRRKSHLLRDLRLSSLWRMYPTGSYEHQQKKFTKTHLAVYNIKQREGESTRAFVTRYTGDTLQIMRLHKEHHISGFVHGLKTRSLVEFLFTDLPTTYKGLMKKTYSWIEAREVAKTFEQPPRMIRSRRSRDMTKYCHFHEDHGDDTNDCWELRHQIKEAMKLGQLAHLLKGIKKIKAKVSDTQPGDRKKGNKDTTLLKAHILMINKEDHTPKRKSMEEPVAGLGEITFPLSLKVDSKVPLIGFSREHSYPLGKVPLVITIGIVVSTIHGSIKFHTPRGIGTVFSTYEPDKICEGQKKLRESPLEVTKGVLSSADTKERIVVNGKYLEWMVIIRKQLPPTFKKLLQDLLKTNADIFAWTQADMMGISRNIIVGGKPFNTEHKLNEYKHIKPIKQKKRRLGPDHTRQHARRLVDKVFNDQIGRNLEAYVDDMVIMSTSEEYMIKDIQETLDRGRNSVKGQILADILAETPLAESKEKESKETTNEEEEPKNMWKLYTDGASSYDGSGAEYEALLAGLRIAVSMKVQDLNIFVDSHLVYGSEAVVSIEISMETKRIKEFKVKTNEKRRREDLDILKEQKEMCFIREAYYNHELDGYYNKRVRPSTFKPVKKAYGYGAYKLETLSGSPINRTWNGLNLHKFYT